MLKLLKELHIYTTNRIYMSKKIEHYQAKKLGMDFDGKPVVQLSYKGKFTEAEIIAHTQTVSNDFRATGFNGQISINARWAPGARGWRSGMFTNMGDPVDWHNDGDWYEEALEPPEYFKEFRLFVIKF